MSIAEMCWGDVGSAAVAAAPGPRQLRDRVGRRRRAAGAVRRRVGLDGDHRARHRLRLGQHPDHRRPRRRRVRPQRREDLRHLGRALRRRRGLGDPRQDPRPRGDQVVRGAEGHARHDRGAARAQARHPAPPTPPTIRFDDCRVPAENLLGSPEIDTAAQGFAGAMATFDNTRPLVAAMAVGCAQAALDLTRDLLEQAGVDRRLRPPGARPSAAAAAKFLQMEADWEGARLLMLQAAWMADNRQANSLEASMAKAKAGRVGLRRHAVVRRAVRLGRLQRGRAAGEVGPRLQDPRHLRGHPADPAADRGPPGPRAVQRRAEVAEAHRR